MALKFAGARFPVTSERKVGRRKIGLGLPCSGEVFK
jgi:hypothetical protein